MAGLEWLAERVSTKKNTKFPNNPYKLNTYQFVEQETMRSRSSLGTSQIVQNLSSGNVVDKSNVLSEERLDK